MYLSNLDQLTVQLALAVCGRLGFHADTTAATWEMARYVTSSTVGPLSRVTTYLGEMNNEYKWVTAVKRTRPTVNCHHLDLLCQACCCLANRLAQNCHGQPSSRCSPDVSSTPTNDRGGHYAAAGPTADVSPASRGTLGSCHGRAGQRPRFSSGMQVLEALCPSL